jgi:hypothetical protein
MGYFSFIFRITTAGIAFFTTATSTSISSPSNVCCWCSTPPPPHVINRQSPKVSRLYCSTRRDFLQTTIASSTAASLLVPSVSHAAIEAESTNLQTGLLESRVLGNVLSPPPYQLEGSDIYYPDYFQGVWNVVSTTKDVQAPCGILLFGGNNTFSRAQEEINTCLSYKARFVPSSSSSNLGIIADREYNVVEIAKAAMGETAVLDVPVSTPNKVSVILAPSGANQILKADLITLARRSEMVNDDEFHCSEVVRQVVGSVNPTNNNNTNNNNNDNREGTTAAAVVGNKRPASTTLLKEIETASLYTAIRDDKGNINEIQCLQRSATFLLPSQQDPIAYKMWEASRGKPIDVRFYSVVYTRRV